MAINLAGAIGMTGKRESVLSDVPSYIQDTGNYLAARNEQRRKEEAAKKAAENEQLSTKYDALSKNANVRLGSRNQKWNDYYDKLAKEELYKVGQVINNPNASLAEKNRVMEDAHYKIADAFGTYKTAEASYDKVNPLINNEDYDATQAIAHLEGTLNPNKVENVIPTQGNPLAQIPQSDVSTDQSKAPLASSNPLSAVEQRNDIATTYENRIPFNEMSPEEIKKFYPKGVEAAVMPLIKHKGASIGEVMRESLGEKPDYYHRDVTKNADGTDSVREFIDTKRLVGDSEKMAIDIITGKTKNGRLFRNQLSQEGFQEARELGIQDPDKLKAHVDDYVKSHAIAASKFALNNVLENSKNTNRSTDRNPDNGTGANNANNANVEVVEKGKRMFFEPQAEKKITDMETSLERLKQERDNKIKSLENDNQIEQYGKMVDNKIKDNPELLAKTIKHTEESYNKLMKQQQENLDNYKKQNQREVKKIFSLNMLNNEGITMYDEEYPQGVIVRPNVVEQTDNGGYVVGWVTDPDDDSKQIQKRFNFNTVGNKSAFLGAVKDKKLSVAKEFVDELSKPSTESKKSVSSTTENQNTGKKEEKKQQVSVMTFEDYVKAYENKYGKADADVRKVLKKKWDAK